VTAVGAATAPVAAAHTLAPEVVIARIAGTATVEAAARDATTPRLLVVRVGPGWERLGPTERLALAEEWHRHWRDAVPQGIVAVLDAGSGRPVVNFDGAGRARATTPPPR
jgi:hypothetical protein